MSKEEDLSQMVEKLERVILAQKVHISTLENQLAPFKQLACVLKDLAEEESRL